MPHSDNSFNQIIGKLIAQKKYQKYLDIGAGAGKYVDIIRERIPFAFIEGIEGDKHFIKYFKLHQKYDKLYHTMVEHFFDQKPNYTTDMVIIGDLIEHLKKSDGIDLLHYLVYRCKCIVVVFPTKYVQYDLKGHSLQAHRSVWDRSDFKQFEHTFKSKGLISMVTIKGYLDDEAAIIIGDELG